MRIVKLRAIANSLLNPHDRTSIRQHHEAVRMVVSLKKHESAQAKSNRHVLINDTIYTLTVTPAYYTVP